MQCFLQDLRYTARLLSGGQQQRVAVAHALDPISRMKPEINKANNSVAAQCPTCHATMSFDAHDASVI